MDACSDACDGEAGALLADLERRQDDVLAQLDALDRQLAGLLRGLGVTLVDDAEAASATQETDLAGTADWADEAPPTCDSDDEQARQQRKRQEIRAATWDEPRWEHAEGAAVTATAQQAARCAEAQDDSTAAVAAGFTKLPRQETTAARQRPRSTAADTAAGRKRAA